MPGTGERWATSKAPADWTGRQGLALRAKLKSDRERKDSLKYTADDLAAARTAAYQQGVDAAFSSAFRDGLDAATEALLSLGEAELLARRAEYIAEFGPTEPGHDA